MAKSSLEKMKERLKKSSPKISGRANLENMNQIRNFVFGKSKKMGPEDDVVGIAVQKAKKKITDSKNKNKKTNTTKKPSSGGGQGQSKGNIYLRTGKDTSMTLLGGSARKITPYKFDKDGVKSINKNKTKKTTPTKTTTKSKITQGSTMTKKKNPSIVTKEQLKKSGLSLRDYMNFMQGKTRKDDKKKTTSPKKVTLKASQMPKRKPVMVDDFKKSKVKSDAKKTSAGNTTKTKKSFMDKVKADIEKAIKETKRNFQGDATKGTGRYKSVNKNNLDSKGNYKGTNIKPTELQLSRMKNKKMMGGGYAMKSKKKMMGGGYSTKKKK